MFHLVDARLKKWAELALEGSFNGNKPEVKLEAPVRSQSGLVISLFLLEVIHDKALARSTRPFPQPALRYLVTASGASEFAHQALGILLWNAFNIKKMWRSEVMQQLPGAEFVGDQLFQVPYHPKLELEPVPSRIWSAFDTPPQPSFILRVPMPFEWLERPLPRVTGLAEQEIHPASGMITLYGQILQQVTLSTAGDKIDEIAVRGASVELASPYRQTYTDRQGRFSLSGVPRNKQNSYVVDVRLGNGTLIPHVTLKGSGTEAVPVSINVNFLHGQLVDNNGTPIAAALIQLALPERLHTYYRERVLHGMQLPPTTPDNQVPDLAERIVNLLPDYLNPYRQVTSDPAGMFVIPAVLSDPAPKELTIITKNSKGELIERTEQFLSSGRLQDPAKLVINLV